MTDTIAPATPPRHPISGKLQKLSREDFLALADPEIRDRVSALIDKADGIVCYENIDMSSSQLGHRSFMIYGPTCTYTTIEECAKGRLGDVPSRFQYPRYFHERKTDGQPG